MGTQRWGGDREVSREDGLVKKPPPPRYAVIPGFCSECGGDKPCVIQVPFKTAALEAGMVRPLCRECLVRMLDTLGEWELDQELLVEAKVRAGEGVLPSSPSVDEVEKEPQDVVQAGLDAGDGEAEAEDLDRMRRAVVDEPIKIKKAERCEGVGYHCTECEDRECSEIYYVIYRNLTVHWYCKDCVPDEVLKKLGEVKDGKS